MDYENSEQSIHSAANKGHASIVESLLAANPRLAARRDDDERLPLHWAVANDHRDVVELLSNVRGFDPDAQDGSGWTPLMIAASLPEQTPIVDFLLQKGADVNAKTFNGQTALHLCVSKNSLNVARKLIEHKASVRVKDRRGQLPLHRAAAIGSVPLLKLLLDNGSPLDATDSAGQAALHHAISEGHGDAALLLLREGAQTDRRDVDGQLAIDLAPDSKVRNFVIRSAEREGIDLQQ